MMSDSSGSLNKDAEIVPAGPLTENESKLSLESDSDGDISVPVEFVTSMECMLQDIAAQMRNQSARITSLETQCDTIKGYMAQHGPR
jgi:hypothetical protein